MDMGERKVTNLCRNLVQLPQVHFAVVLMLMKLVVTKDEAVTTVKGSLGARAALSSCFGVCDNLLTLSPTA
jgi:hypothetical protein